jgi:outer membrane protein OmpA-like peptidoglycan-associated protein
LGARIGTSPLASDGLLYLSDDAGKIHVLPPDTLQTVASFPNHSRQGAWFSGAGMRLYLVAESGDLLELDKTSGDVLRRTPIEGRPARGTPLLFSGRVLLPVADRVVCFGAPAGSRPDSTPLVDPPRSLLVRIIDGKTRAPLGGEVRVVLADAAGSRTVRLTLAAGQPARLAIRSYPATIRFEKEGFHALRRVFASGESGPVVDVPLERLRDGDGIVLEDVRFASDSSALSAESLPALEALARFLRDNPGFGALVRGHTDSTGDPARNLALSAERARIVRDYLVKQNISAARLRVEGCGAREPVADNAGEAGRRLNRRTEVRFFAWKQEGDR